MWIQETVVFDVARAQRGLDSVESPSNTYRVANPKSGRARRMRGRFNKRRPDEMQKGIRTGYCHVKI